MIIVELRKLFRRPRTWISVFLLCLLPTIVAVSGLAVGVLVIGEQTGTAGSTITVSGTSLSTTQLAVRAGLMMAYIGWSMLGVASVSLFLSTLTDSALGAALGGIAVLVGSSVLVGLDAADSVNAWLPTRYWLAWVDLFRDPILWHDIQRGVLIQAVWIAVLLGMAWANFTARDVSS